MSKIPITAVTLALLLGTTPAWSQNTALTRAQTDARQSGDQFVRDRQVLEAARKSGDRAKIRAAEEKARASETTFKQKRSAVETERRQAQLRQDRAELEAARKSGNPARIKAAEAKIGASRKEVRGDRQRTDSEAATGDRSGKGKSGWAHAEKKGRGHND